MFITKKHISRRAMLKSAGVALGLMGLCLMRRLTHRLRWLFPNRGRSNHRPQKLYLSKKQEKK